MKKLAALTALCALLSMSGKAMGQEHIRENRGKFVYPATALEGAAQTSRRKQLNSLKAAKELAAIKLDIINGNYERAQIRLQKAGGDAVFSEPAKARYQAIMNFVSGNYERSLEALNSPVLSAEIHQDNICLLKTLNLVILDKAERAQKAWNDCLKWIAGKDGGNNVWISALLDLKQAQTKNKAANVLEGVSIENERGDKLRLFLKLALYLNKQELIFKRVPYLSTQAFQSPKTRELLGLLYFRDLQLAKAYELIEDLSTPNSENIKGNLLLAQKKYELAYAQFKLALARKSNSQNSLERIVPTAWRLRQWSEGADFVRRLEESASNSDSKRALLAAFLTKQKKPAMALQQLASIEDKQATGRTLEVNQLYAYNHLALGENEKAFEKADLACRQQDAFHCWLASHLLVWEDFSALTKRKDKVFEEKSGLLDAFMGGFKKDPIQETVYINQKDIEELEDAQIDLSPQ